MKQKRLCRCRPALIVLVFVMAASAQADDVTMSLNDFKDGVISREARYAEGRFKFAETVFNKSAPLKLFSYYDYDVTKSGDKYFLSRTSQLQGSVPRIDHGAWDGSIRTGYTAIPSAPPDRRYSGSIKSKNDEATHGKWTEITNEIFYEAGVRIDAAMHLWEWDLIGPKMIGGYKAWGVRSKNLARAHQGTLGCTRP